MEEDSNFGGKKYKYHDFLKDKQEKHKGEWLTQDLAIEYRKKAASIPNYGGQMVGELRALRIEMQERFGITELDATLILNGRYYRDVVDKWEDIRKFNPNEKK